MADREMADAEMADGRLVAGRYRLLRPLAAGGASQVWLATDEMLHRRVTVRKCGLTMPQARALARIGDPNLLGVLDVLPGDDEPWIVLEYVPARSLLQVVREAGPLEPARAATIGLAVLHALTAMGSTGVPHVDVEPATVLIGDAGRVVLSDIGPPLTTADSGAVRGSARYRAPERASGEGPTVPADLWSLGATLLHAVEGRPPAAGGTPDPPRQAGRLTAVLESLLRADPSARPSPSEVEEALRRVATPPPPAEERPAAAAVPPAPQRFRWAVLAAVTVIAAAAAAGAAATRTGDDRVAPRPPAPATPSARPHQALPRGFTWWNDPAGFRVAVPRGWRHRHDPGGVLALTGPPGRPTLRVSGPAGRPPDVFTALTAEESRRTLAAYRRVRIEALPGPSAAVWEYTFQDPSGVPMRGQRRLLVTDGHAYALEWRAPRSAWAANLPTVTVVLDSFEPVAGA
ncbi:serine/threonine protein kinase [Couchioplanes caeruleus]|uniref:serine/threonine-protein kinase n=1 Tax=Couchioplanes caeruleus TaxID=56438 RepID=UPI0020C01DCC|nr:serine/threonine-protein kinase [Couchioplanes caeruleus]UQU62807.1 serine/threonine protein kinase [Couchioplanes caeruleus]